MRNVVHFDFYKDYRMIRNELFNETQAAEYIGGKENPIPLGTIRRWRTEGKYLPFIRIGGRAIRYSKADLDNYLENSVRTSTTDNGSAAND